VINIKSVDIPIVISAIAITAEVIVSFLFGEMPSVAYMVTAVFYIWGTYYALKAWNPDL